MGNIFWVRWIQQDYYHLVRLEDRMGIKEDRAWKDCQVLVLSMKWFNFSKFFS